MTTKQEWGNVCWYLFHSLSFKLKDDKDHIVKDLQSICHNIALNLPCPDCSEHANQTFNMAKNSGVRITNRDEMQRFWWQLHNLVNKRLRKPSMSFEDAQEIYSKARLETDLIQFSALLFQQKRVWIIPPAHTHPHP